MQTRSEVRHACYRAKNGAATEKNLEVLKLVEPKLEIHQRWENFAEVWDIIVINNEIKVISPEVDLDFVKATCLEKQFHVKYNASTADWTDRQLNVISIVESQMLEGVMTWSNFNTDWGVTVDPALKMISAKMYVKPIQKEVTEEMILASRISEDGTPYVGDQVSEVKLEAAPMDAQQKKAFEEFLARKSQKE